ncbi:hypothetical protein N9R31_00035 [bacterium]|nr:hypothetical protein [bacterium]
MTSPPTVQDQLVKIANSLARFTREPSEYDNYADLSEKASTSIKRSALYCYNIIETGFFDLHNIQSEQRNLEIALKKFKNVFSDKYSPINDELDRVEKSLESLSLSYRESTLPIPKTKPPNHKTRYVAAIIANCYYDKFTRWPITPSNNPKRAFRTHTEEICFILDKKNLYGITGACNNFSQNPWRLWDKSPPFISR